jgi:ribosome-associated translation inhibitor RaiA
METPAKITFHQLPHSDGLESEVLNQITELERLHDRITSCRVTIEAPPRHQQHGRQFGVHVDLRIPGAEIIADRSRSGHEDPYVAVRDAFRAARRQLEDHVQRQRLASA